MAAFAGKPKKILMVAFAAFHPGKPVTEYTTIKILVYDFFYMGSKVAILLVESPVV